jgi:hypothetical protein
MQKKDLAQISRNLDLYWTRIANTQSFKDKIIGKEIGHSISSYVDEKTIELIISLGFKVYYQVDSKTQKLTKRSFGDGWIEDTNGRKQPLNVKTGILNEKSDGQPNMMSFERLKNNLLNGTIDSYFLVIVKFVISDSNDIIAKTAIVDFLNYLDCATYNFGVGQIMLNQKKFYLELEKADPSRDNISLEEKVILLEKLYANGLDVADKKMLEARKKAQNFSNFLLEKAKHKCEEFPNNCNCKITDTTYKPLKKTDYSFISA